jgi:predicted GNAT family acetyltransferase
VTSTIVRHATAAEFLTATEEFRAGNPLLTNIMGSVAAGVVAGRTYESELWLTVHDDDSLIGMAMRTAPWNLAVSAMPTAAAESLGRYVAGVDPAVPGVNGPQETVDAVVRGLAPGPGRMPRTDMVDVLRVLTLLQPPAGVPGAARAAQDGDVPLLLDWHRGFADDAGLPTHSIEESVRQQVSDGTLWLWEDAGVPVSMAGHAPLVTTPTGTVARIGPVYTPAHLRGHGFAAAVTAAVTGRLLTRCSTVMLFADAARPEINRLYERLGFAEAARIVEVSLDA